MKPYPAYKDSGVPWIGEVPEGWALRRLKFAAAINPSKSELTGAPETLDVSFYPMEAIGFGYLNQGEVKSLDAIASGYTYFRDDDVLIAKITPSFENGKGALATGLKNGIGFGSTEIHVIRPQEDIDKHFLYYITYSHPFREVGAGMMEGTAGQKRVPTDFLANYLIALPSLPEQRAIAAYLDHKTAQIDSLIANKRRRLELLAEERTALISHAVTKGLDPDAPLKDSGVAWIGEIPAGWEVKKLKHIFHFLDHRRIPLSADERGRMTNKIYDYYGASGIIDKVDDYIFTETTILIGEDGANLLTRSSRLAFIAQGEYWVNNHAHILVPKNGDIHYFVELLEAVDYTNFVTGSAQPKLNQENLGNILLPVPPLPEQRAIAAYLDEKTAHIDRALLHTEQQITLLEEYRTALISAAVTGKIDVRATRLGQSSATPPSSTPGDNLVKRQQPRAQKTGPILSAPPSSTPQTGPIS